MRNTRQLAQLTGVFGWRIWKVAGLKKTRRNTGDIESGASSLMMTDLATAKIGGRCLRVALRLCE